MTGEALVPPPYVRDVLSVMHMCGNTFAGEAEDAIFGAIEESEAVATNCPLPNE